MSIVNKIISEAKLSELFGLSQKEKQAKLLQVKVAQALKEINNYQFDHLFAQTGIGLSKEVENQQMRSLVNGILIRSAQQMPTFSELFPDMFKFQLVGKCIFDYKEERLYGVFPSQWGFAVINSIFLPDKAKQIAEKKVNNLIQKKQK